MPKVLITTPSFAKFSEEPMNVLHQAGLTPVRVQKHPITDEKDLLEYLDEDVQAIITGLEPIGRTVMEAAKGLKVVIKHGIGVDNIDLEAARELGICVANTPGANKEGVADFAFGLMLAAARKIPQADRSIKEGRWEGFFGSSVYGRTLGIVGMGAIGKAMAMRAKGFSMKILGYDPFWDEAFAAQNGIRRCTLEEILKESDFITIHVPLMKQTENLIDEPQLRMMKKSAFLINAARGGIVNEKALYTACKEGWIAGAGLDAFSKEPVDTDDPLPKLSNVIATAHIAFYCDEAMNSTSLFAAKVAEQFLCEPLPERKPGWLVVDAR